MIREVAETTARHLIAGLLFLALLLPVFMLTEHLFRPFDNVLSVRAMRVGLREVIITWDLHVYRRFPVSFSSRFVHTQSGRVADQREFGPSTGKTGRFTLKQHRELPVDADAGEWCHIVEGRVIYNALNTQVRSYPHACIIVQEAP